MEKAGREGDGAPCGPVLHIVVVGFHHKKGCQVEFSYPPLIPGDGHDSHALPEEWKYLPFLALPDGAHNYQEDTVFFHLPPRNGNGATVYGISCYRQIEAKALKVRQADITRETVQKSVCVLSKLPLYGLLQAKLQLITHAYFEEKDFSQISILKELYEHMNSSLGGASLEGSQVYLGLSPRDLVLHFRHKVLILFKLILLEKKVLFYISPVNRLVGALMTVLSLFPGMIEHGLSDCSQYRPRKSMSEDIGLQQSNPPADDFISESTSDISNTNLGTVTKIISGNHGGDTVLQLEKPCFQVEDNNNKEQEPSDTGRYLKLPPRPSPESSESDWETLDPSVLEDSSLKEREQMESDQTNIFQKDSVPSDSPPITVQPQANTRQVVLIPGLISGLEEDQYGMPLAIFTKVEEALIQIHDPELRKLLNPTTADLRFADYLVRHVTENRDDVFLDGTGWEGGDEWIRAQFAVYIHALLAATLQLDNEKMLSDYGTTFVAAWKNTHNYRVWNSNKHPALSEINPNHPFQGQYSVSDMKLRFSHSVQNSERGKKIGNVMVSTSRNVVQTGKAVGQSVGGAFSSAKTAMSSWLSTFTTSTPQSLPEPPNGKP
ncbi:late secretory pathway protein AVL9 homolog isoform X2 [Cricetulus griseus]|uniref:Late secretory pathway protein AVL9 homolog isoform X2 n=1 Tax=Cricetulus griseus TaxID=10029 RepID=A0A9J7GH57_CRIGR|nr:late secretory pathway protein AVL9 homolog isoform X2 [Cricetulus griseus]XP_027285511.1 late secretory pathway protein AVL9 homolog isoform X2 [Cricetulus griseus]